MDVMNKKRGGKDLDISEGQYGVRQRKRIGGMNY